MGVCLCSVHLGLFLGHRYHHGLENHLPCCKQTVNISYFWESSSCEGCKIDNGDINKSNFVWFQNMYDKGKLLGQKFCPHETMFCVAFATSSPAASSASTITASAAAPTSASTVSTTTTAAPQPTAGRCWLRICSNELYFHGTTYKKTKRKFLCWHPRKAGLRYRQAAAEVNYLQWSLQVDISAQKYIMENICERTFKEGKRQLKWQESKLHFKF